MSHIRDKWDLFHLGMAQYAGTASKDPSTKCGAVIAADDNSILSIGFNGFPRDMEDRDEWWNNREEKLSRVVHAEMNALIHANRKKLPEGVTLYTYPFISCDRCIVHMLQAGIRRFVAPEATKAQAERWGDSFAKTRKYILECNAELVEFSTH